MNNGNSLARWGGIAAIASGVIFLVPLVFYFLLLPAAGSSATHAKDPISFLPWMAEHGNLRIALWWIVSAAFTFALFGVPSALRRTLEEQSPAAARVSELAGILGTFTLVVSSLSLAAGELPIAKAFVDATSGNRESIVALYEWQRLTTALLFDVLGFAFLGIWICVASMAIVRHRSLPLSIGIFGLIAAALCFCFAIGYATQVSWLGESGIGAASFLAIPAWLIWIGVLFIRSSR